MKIQNLSRALVLFAVAVLASCGGAGSSGVATAVVPVSTGASTVGNGGGHAESVMREVNGYRHQKGKRPLERHAGLERMALAHSEYLRKNRGTFGLYGKNVSHHGFESRAMEARYKFRMISVGENVAAANLDSKNPGPVMMQIWADSPGHEHNMRAAWTHTGVGVVVDADGMVFATQLFGIAGDWRLPEPGKARQF